MAELSSNLLYNVGVCYFNGYDMTRAEIFFNEAIIIKPSYTKALHKRAVARFEMGKVE
jgi:Tfp pilus assembly protein PilF